MGTVNIRQVLVEAGVCGRTYMTSALGNEFNMTPSDYRPHQRNPLLLRSASSFTLTAYRASALRIAPIAPLLVNAAKVVRAILG